jgi:ubiquinone biosynthesis protein UbiJ
MEVRTTPVTLRLESTGTALLLTRRDAAVAAQMPADAAIAGTPFALLTLAGATPEAAIQRGDVAITGDAQIAQTFRELGMLLRPDMEEELSRLVGDTVAHRVAGVARDLAGWGRRAGKTTLRNVAEYLAHERGDLVPQTEAESFFAGIERLRDQAARLDARIAELEKKAGTS